MLMESGQALFTVNPGKACRISEEKPVIVLKAGRTASGASAVNSHTGRLAGSDRVMSGAFRQFGILRMMDERVKKLFEEYRHSDRKKRIDMWLMFPEAR